MLTPPPSVLRYEADLTAYLANDFNQHISFGDYQIVSETGQLDPTGWNSIADQALADPSSVQLALGAGALSFGETNSAAGSVAERSAADAATLAPGQKFYLGKPFGDGDFFVKFSSESLGLAQRLYVPRIPEPSTFLLAALAGVGLLAIPRRGASQPDRCGLCSQRR